MSGSWSDWELGDDPPTLLTYIPREHTLDASLAQQQREIGALCLSVTQLETRLEDAHLVMARQAATIARLRRRGPRSWEWALAWLVCRLDAANKRMDPWYSFESTRRGK